MSTYISKLCSSAFFHLHNISRIRKFLSREETKTFLVHALVTSRVDYFNSLLYSLPASQLNKVQRVLNTAAKLVCCAQRFSHITPATDVWATLTSIKAAHSFKILLFAFKAIHGIAPPYIQKSQGAYNLRSSTFRTKVIPGDRSFQVASAKLWNALSRELCDIPNLNTFKSNLRKRRTF